MPEIEEVPGQPDPLYPSMALLVEVGVLVAPKNAHRGIADYARHLQETTTRNLGFRAEARLMRALQDGIDFGHWPRI